MAAQSSGSHSPVPHSRDGWVRLKARAGSAASITLDPATTGAVWNAAHDNADALDANSVANIRYIVKHALDKVEASVGGGVSLSAGFSC